MVLSSGTSFLSTKVSSVHCLNRGSEALGSPVRILFSSKIEGILCLRGSYLHIAIARSKKVVSIGFTAPSDNS